jgi:hypothetical protein
MPGRMGNERVTVKNLKVLQVDETSGVVVVKGILASFLPNGENGRSIGMAVLTCVSRLRARSQRSDYLSPGCY